MVEDTQVAEQPGAESVEPPVGQVSDVEAMGDAYDKIMAEHEPEAAPAPEDKTDDQPRDEKGQFTSKDGEESDEAKSEAKEPEAKEDDKASLEGEGAGADDDTDRTPPQEVEPAPAHLQPDVKAVWADMPENVRSAIAKQSSDYHKKVGELGRDFANYRPTQQVVEEFNEYFDGTKGSYKPDEAMRYLFGLQREMDKDPLNTIMQIADTYGIRDQLSAPTDATREVVALRQTISELKGQLEQQASPENINTAVSQAIDEREVEKAIETFASEQPFYADIEDRIPPFIEIARGELGEDAAPIKVLETAYTMAVQALPDVRAKKDAADKAASEAKDVDKKAASAPDPKRAENARKAASVNVKSTSSGEGRTLTEDEALSAAYDRARAS